MGCIRHACFCGVLEVFKRLLRDAAEGLPVAGRTPTWEQGRPKTLPVGEPVKVRLLTDLRVRCLLPAFNSASEALIRVAMHV